MMILLILSNDLTSTWIYPISSKLIHSLQLNTGFKFFIYDLMENRFIYSCPEKSKIFNDLPDEHVNKGYMYLKKIFHPIDFGNLVKEVITLMHSSERINRKIIKTDNGGQILRTKNKNGDWQPLKIHLIYLNERRNQRYKLLLVFAEDDTTIQDLNITPREKEIFSLLSLGFSSKMIAGKLNISINTVITHRKNLIHKLNVNNSAELIKKGFELNLIS